MTWTKLRDLTTPQTAEGRTAPSAGAFLGLEDVEKFAQDGNRLAYVELRFDAVTLAGTAAADSVTFGIWRKSDGKVDRVGSITILAADIGSPQPLILDFHGESIALKVESFSGGTAPNVATIVWARPVRP